jgi:hypothetical protein
MAVATGVAIGAGLAVSAAGLVGSTLLQGAAQSKAAKERLAALSRLESLVPGIENIAARKADTERLAGQLKLQRELDPAAATLRESSLREAARGLDTEQDQAAASLGLDFYRENRSEDPQILALKTRLLADAREALDAGATLPAEFQAELVRTGLERVGQAGIVPTAKGAAGQTTRRLIGSAGIALQEQRRLRAVSDIAAAQDITKTRANILGSMIPLLQSIGTTRSARALAGAQVGNSLVPEFGLSGRELVSLNLERVNQKNAALLGEGDVRASKALSHGQMLSGLLGAGTGLISSGLALSARNPRSAGGGFNPMAPGQIGAPGP